ncbi:MAG: MFS transporter, partial [Acidovorax sp.]
LRMLVAPWQGAGLQRELGLLCGVTLVRVYSRVLQRVPPMLMGRAMGLFMFIFMGLAPISAAVTGWLMKSITLTQLFAASGGALVVLVALAFVLTPLRQVSDAPRPAG